MATSTIQLKLEAPCELVKEHLKENDIRLSDEDLQYIPGQEEALLQRLENIMGLPREVIIAYIESISANEDKAG